MDLEQLQKDFISAYDSYADAIFRYCFIQTSNRDLARDLSQDTFTKSWEYLITNNKPIENMKAFLYRIATNLIIDYRRKRKQSVSLDSLMEEGYDVKSKEDLNEEQERKFESEEVNKVLGQLDEKYRDVLHLRYVEDMSIKEIAEVTGEGESNVSVRIHRGLEKMKKLLEKPLTTN